MTRSASKAGLWTAALAATLSLSPACPAQIALDEVPDQAKGIVVTERTGQMVDTVVELRDSNNQRVTMSEYLNRTSPEGRPKPVVLTMVYYSCPIVCPVTLNKLSDLLSKVDYDAGEDYELVVVSFNPEEHASDAAEARELSLATYGRTAPSVRAGFHFHTASDVDARALAKSIGFNYRRLPNGEYSHPVSTVILTPEGKISRYLHGLDNQGRPFDMKMALLEATSGKIGKSIGDSLLFTCYRYDPSAGAYNAQAMTIMKIAAVLSVAALSLLIGTLRLGEIARRKLRAGKAAAQDLTTNRPAHAG